MATIRMVGNKVMVDVTPEDDVRDGIVLGQKPPQMVQVISCGSKVRDIAVGDMVLNSGLHGTPIKLDGRQMLIVDANQIIGKV